jgi:hypothetical protein
MNCTECKELLVSYLEGGLTDPERKTVTEHIKTCPSCRAELEGLQTLHDRLVRNGKALSQSPLEDEVMNRIIREQNTRLKGTAQASAGLRIRRLIMKNPITKIVAAAAVLVAVGIAFYSLGSGRPAFGDVVRSILEAHTAVFKIISHEQDQPMQTANGMFMDPGLERTTFQAVDGNTPEWIMVMDYVHCKGLGLIPSRKEVLAFEAENWSGPVDPEKQNQFEDLRKRIRLAQERPDASVQYLGESQVNGHKVIGYRMNEAGEDTTIWANADSLLPVQIERSLIKRGGKPFSWIMTDIEFNVPLDAAEFSTEVPEGYTMRGLKFDSSTPQEADLMEMLRIWTGITGRFPSEVGLEAMKEWIEAFKAKREREGRKPIDEAESLDDPAFQRVLQEDMPLFLKAFRGMAFVKGLSEGSIDWHYTGAEATMGDATKAIFWYQPKDSQTYRVIYADLSVRDVVPEDLPK